MGLWGCRGEGDNGKMRVGVGGDGFPQQGKCGLEHETRATRDGLILLSCSADLEVCGCGEYPLWECGVFPGLLCVLLQLNATSNIAPWKDGWMDVFLCAIPLFNPQ